MEDQPIEVIGDVGQDEFCLGTRDADRADEEPKPVFLIRRLILRRLSQQDTRINWLSNVALRGVKAVSASSSA